MSDTVAPALRALLERFIDYAGLFPPASVPLDATIANYHSYQNSDHRWMLRWLVLPVSQCETVHAALRPSLSLIAEADDGHAAALETKTIVSANRPVYCEVSPDNLTMLDAVKEAGNFAKIRMGSLQPEGIPSVASVAAFINACADRKLPFKATAGLHHPVRALQALTYEDDAPRAVLHGFLNVLMAAAFAWQGRRDIEAILFEAEPAAFSFDDRAYWRDQSLSLAEIKAARHDFIHSVGTCSFDEPVADLRSLRLLP
jgi:hypothetical protein